MSVCVFFSKGFLHLCKYHHVFTYCGFGNIFWTILALDFYGPHTVFCPTSGECPLTYASSVEKWPLATLGTCRALSMDAIHLFWWPLPILDVPFYVNATAEQPLWSLPSPLCLLSHRLIECCLRTHPYILWADFTLNELSIFILFSASYGLGFFWFLTYLPKLICQVVCFNFKENRQNNAFKI